MRESHYLENQARYLAGFLHSELINNLGNSHSLILNWIESDVQFGGLRKWSSPSHVGRSPNLPRPVSSTSAIPLHLCHRYALTHFSSFLPRRYNHCHPPTPSQILLHAFVALSPLYFTALTTLYCSFVWPFIHLLILVLIHSLIHSTKIYQQPTLDQTLLQPRVTQ